MKYDLEPVKEVLRAFLAEIEKIKAIRKSISAPQPALSFTVEDKSPVFDASEFTPAPDSYWEKEDAYIWLYADAWDFRSFMHRPKPKPIPEYYSQPALPVYQQWRQIETKALDLKTKQELLIQKLVNTHSLKGELLSCTIYGSDGQSHYTVSRTYNPIGQVLTETNPEGKITSYTYNACGERIETLITHENRRIVCTYDKLGRLISTKTYAGNLTAEKHFTYDLLSRKTNASATSCRVASGVSIKC